MLANSPLSRVARGGREPGGQGGTATWKTVDVNHLAWAECGLQRGEEQETGKKPWWAGRWRVGLGVARPRGPYLPDCCSPDAFTATAWPIQPADLIPSSPPLQAPLCLPRRLKALAVSSSGERKNRTQPKGEEKPGTLPGQAELGELMCSLCPRPLWASVSPPQTRGREMEGSMTGKQVGVGKNRGRSLKPSPGFLRTGGVILRSQDGTEQDVSLFSRKGSFLKAGGDGQCLLFYAAFLAPACGQWDGTLSPLPQALLSDLSLDPGSRLQPPLGLPFFFFFNFLLFK